MTILTKAFTEKKSDKLDVPLVEEGCGGPTAPQEGEDEPPRRPRIIFFAARPHRMSIPTTFCMLLLAIAGLSVGIIGGKILYDEYLSVSRNLPTKFEGWARIPIDDDEEVQKLIGEQIKAMDALEEWGEQSRNWPQLLNQKYFQENFEIDEEQQYEKIDVPDFRDGRNGRFVHDFNTNITGIIDITGQRCFVMPLNRANVLPPKNMFDLVHKMWDGYYKVDTEVVREHMRVITPPISDTKEIGTYIATECEGMPIYKLEKVVGGVVKRSADLHSEAKFAQFAGKGITEFDIMNLDDVIAYEQQQKDSH